MSKNISARTYALRYGFTEAAIISRIQKGILDGEEKDGEWYVIGSKFAGRRPFARVVEGLRRTRRKTKYVVTYVGTWYIASLCTFLVFGVASDIMGFMLDASQGLPRGMAIRVALLVLIWRRHPRVRIMVKLWAGLMILSGTIGLWFTWQSRDAVEFSSWWVMSVFIVNIGAGITYLFWANTHVIIDEVPVRETLGLTKNEPF